MLLADPDLHSFYSIDRDLSNSSLSSPPSSILQKTIPDIFSLFRALLPVAHQSTLSANPALAMQAVNDCEWLAEQVKTLLGAEDGTAECLRGTGTKWFDEELVRPSFPPPPPTSSLRELTDAISTPLMQARRQTAAHAILDGAYRFVDVGDEQRGSDCESAVVDVLARIEELSSAWKVCPRPNLASLASFPEDRFFFFNLSRSSQRKRHSSPLDRSSTAS